MTRRRARLVPVLVALLLAAGVQLVSPASAFAEPLWSSIPSPFACSRGDNGCVSHTGFDPNVAHWGQDTNPRGNCTNYVAYRVGRNGGSRLAGWGNAISWVDRVRSQFGAAAVNQTPAVGSVAYWGTSKGAAGHVAYVERVEGTTVYISDSVWDRGSNRYTKSPGQAGYPEAFLHIKDDTGSTLPPANTGDNAITYDGGTRTEPAVYSVWDGKWHVAGMGTIATNGGPGQVAAPADYNGDGRVDPAVYSVWDAKWHVAGIGTIATIGGPGQVPVPADYNGDGRADPAVYSVWDGKWHVAGMGTIVTNGGPGQLPVPADYDGDGRADPAVYSVWDAKWHVAGMGTIATLGGPGQVPVPGDYNGDGRIEPAVYSVWDAKWHVAGMGTIATLGGPGQVPVPGDYNGDGRIEPAVYSVWDGKWHVAGMGTIATNGGPGQVPATNARDALAYHASGGCPGERFKDIEMETVRSEMACADTTPTPTPTPDEPRPVPAPVARDITTTCDSRQASSFTDSPGTTHAYAINCVSGWEITKGRTPTIFDPGASLTGGQTATFLVRTLQAAGVQLPEPQDLCAEDADVHAANIERLMTMNVITWRPADRVCNPGAVMSRELMAGWTRNALSVAGVQGDASTNWYTDDDASSYASAIDEITQLGIVTGKGGGLYGPTESLSRGQMATFLARTLDALLEK